MPGIMYHLIFAEKVYRNLTMDVDAVEFFAGNLIPDLALDKKSAHFSTFSSIKECKVPDINTAKKSLCDKSSSIKLGLYCHLYLDYYFIENFLIPEFVYNLDKQEVLNPRNGKTWSFEDFFSRSVKDGVLYNSYTQINSLLLSNGHIKKETLEALPDILPPTNIPLFDVRHEKTWREELNEYLSLNIPYTGEVLDYERLLNFISALAEEFVKNEI